MPTLIEKKIDLGEFGFTKVSELVNGRLAMIGFVLIFASELFCKQTLMNIIY